MTQEDTGSRYWDLVELRDRITLANAQYQGGATTYSIYPDDRRDLLALLDAAVAASPAPSGKESGEVT